MNPKYIITDPPRSGTTFLIALLFYLGIDMGFNAKDVNYAMSTNIGSLEYLRSRKTRKKARQKQYPLIIKQPYVLPLAGKLPNILPPEQILVQDYRENWPIKHVFITKRDLEKNVLSYVKRDAEKCSRSERREFLGFELSYLDI